MTTTINFVTLYEQLREWFDAPTPLYRDFDAWRYECYADLDAGRLRNLPLKTWWPRYTNGDHSLELCVGALLVYQTNWSSVKNCIRHINRYLMLEGRTFDLDGLLTIPVPELEELIRPSGYFRQKADRIQRFCRHVRQHSGTLNPFIGAHSPSELEAALSSLKAGFGPETRHAVLLYVGGCPRFIGDAYARRLLRQLGALDTDSYWECQRIFQEGIKRDFAETRLQSLAQEYTPEERRYALNGAGSSRESALVLLYQQFHAGIVELGISKRIEEFVDELLTAKRP